MFLVHTKTKKLAFSNSSGMKNGFEKLRFRDGLDSFSKPRRRRLRERHQTKGLMSRTMVVHVRIVRINHRKDLFQDAFRPHENEKLAFSNPLRLKKLFGKAPFS